MSVMNRNQMLNIICPLEVLQIDITYNSNLQSDQNMLFYLVKGRAARLKVFNDLYIF